MSILPASAVRTLRTLIESGMTGTCSVRRPLPYAEGPGGSNANAGQYGVVAGLEGVDCSFRPAADPAEVVVADSERAAQTYSVGFPHGTDVRRNDRLVITHTEPGVPSPLVLDVVGPRYRTGEIVRRVIAELVEVAP